MFMISWILLIPFLSQANFCMWVVTLLGFTCYVFKDARVMMCMHEQSLLLIIYMEQVFDKSTGMYMWLCVIENGYWKSIIGNLQRLLL